MHLHSVCMTGTSFKTCEATGMTACIRVPGQGNGGFKMHDVCRYTEESIESQHGLEAMSRPLLLCCIHLNRVARQSLKGGLLQSLLFQRLYAVSSCELSHRYITNASDVSASCENALQSTVIFVEQVTKAGPYQCRSSHASRCIDKPR